MRFSYILNKYLLLSLLVGANCTLFAQVKPEEKIPEEQSKTSVTEEIEVVRSYKPVLADAVKIRRSPDLNVKKVFNPKVKYSLLDKRLELNSEIRELEAQKLLLQEDKELHNNFAKFGVGGLGSTLGALHLGTGRDEALQAGFNFNHWAMSNGKLNQQKMAEQEVGLYGRSIGDNVIIDGKLGYTRRSNYFYGIDPDNSFSNPDPKKQRFNFIEGEGEIYNRIDPYDEMKLAYAAKLNGYLFNNIFEGKENAVIVSGGLSKNFNKFQLGVNGAVDFTSTRDRAYGKFNNHIFKLNPFVKIDGEKFKLTAGINYVNEFGDNASTHLFPAASIDFSLIENYLSIFGSFEGDVHKTRLKDLSFTNPFLNENINIRNQVEKFNLTGGVKGTLAANIGYKAAIHYKTIGNFNYFVNDTLKKETFNVEYIGENTNVLGLTGELNIQFSEVFRLDGKLELNQYNLKNELNAWHHPGIKLSSNASFNIADKVKLSADLYFQGDTKAKLYTYDTPTGTGPGPVTTTVKVLKAFADFGVGAEYQYNKRISGFIKANNLLGNDYQRYLFYPNFGFNILGGISYGF
jgi:hypothetical protein